MSRRNNGPRLRFLEKRGCYYITWTERGRSRERSTGTADREQAQIALADFLQQRGSNAGPRDPAEMLVTEALTIYAAERGPHVMAPGQMGRSIAALIGPWEGKRVSHITPASCEAYAAKRAREPGTTRRELGVLQAAVNWAHRNGRLTRSVRVTLPATPPPRDRWLTRDEAARLIREARACPIARHYLPLAILVGLYTGRRIQAVLSLRWPQVDLDAGLIDFEGAHRRSRKRRGKPPIAPRLLPHLRRARRRGTDLGHVIHKPDGSRIGTVQKCFGAACQRAGLSDVTPHTLRHTAATWLLQADISIWQAAEYLAMSERTLIATYGHHAPEYQRAAAAAIGGRPRNVRVSS